MPDPRALPIDVGPFRLEAAPDVGTWTAVPRGGAEEASSGITGSWTQWVAFAERVRRADELWRDREARGDAWDEGFVAARDAAAVNPYR